MNLTLQVGALANSPEVTVNGKPALIGNVGSKTCTVSSELKFAGPAGGNI